MIFGYIPLIKEKFLMINIVPGLTIEAIIMFLIATPVEFWLGRSFWIASFEILKNCKTNMDVLIVIGFKIKI